MKKRLLVFLISGLLLFLGNPLYALTLDLTDGTTSGTINGADFAIDDTHPAGTGVFQPFVRLQATGNDPDLEEGTNYNPDVWGNGPGDLDEKAAWLAVLTADYIFTLDGQQYVKFELDVDEPAGLDKEFLSLDQLVLFAADNDEQYPYPAFDGHEANDLPPETTLVWTMNAFDLAPNDDTLLTDNNVLLDYLTISMGAGAADMSVLIPVTPDITGQYLYLYSQFSGMNNNPEEWRMVQAAAPIPEPSTILLLGAGLVGLGLYGRKRGKK